MVGLATRLLWYYTPSTESVLCQASGSVVTSEAYPSPKVSTCGHVFLSFLWIAAVASFGTFASYQWLTAPDVTTLAQVSASGQAPLAVQLSVQCTNPPNCGDVTITVDYTAVAGCASIPLRSKRIAAADSGAATIVPVTLCYTASTVFTTNTPGALAVPGVVVDFDAVNPGTDTYRGEPAPQLFAQGLVSIWTADGTRGVSTVAVESWQVKTQMVGQSITSRDTAVESVEPYPLAVQYEGRRPTWRATVVVALAPYANVATVLTGPHNFNVHKIVGLIGTIAGSVFTIGAVIAKLVPWAPKFFPGPAAATAKAAVATRGASGAAEELISGSELSEQQHKPTTKAKHTIMEDM